MQNEAHAESRQAIMLVCHAAPALGIGHLARMLVLVQELQMRGHPELRLLIVGEKFERAGLSGVSHVFIPLETDFSLAVEQHIDAFKPQLVVFDLHPRLLFPGLTTLFSALRERHIGLVGVDSLLPFSHALSLVWIPSFFVPPDWLPPVLDNVRYGWDCYLMRQRCTVPLWSPGPRVLILTGGSDATHQGATLPSLLDTSLPAGTEIHWVQGPFSQPPKLPAGPKLTWILHHAPESLDHLMVSCNYALAVFGVSFFELLQYGVPSVVFSPYGNQDTAILAALRNENVAVVAESAAEAANELCKLMEQPEMAAACSVRARQKLSARGAPLLAAEILLLTGS